MFNKICFVILLFLVITGCKKDDVDLSNIPAISFLSISPSSATEYSDKVIIKIHYEDGDGDLGENKDGVKNCFVTDNRNGVVYTYRIKQLAPDGTSIAIAGDLNIDIGGQILTDSSSQQSATYSLYLVDRSGNKSNTLTTSSIVINR